MTTIAVQGVALLLGCVGVVALVEVVRVAGRIAEALERLPSREDGDR